MHTQECNEKIRLHTKELEEVLNFKDSALFEMLTVCLSHFQLVFEALAKIFVLGQVISYQELRISIPVSS